MTSSQEISNGALARDAFWPQSYLYSPELSGVLEPVERLPR
jgi:hypothetical protein